MDGRVGSRKALQGAGGLGSTQGQGSSVSRRAGGLSGLLRQGRGIQGEAGRPPPHPPEFVTLKIYSRYVCARFTLQASLVAQTVKNLPAASET